MTLPATLLAATAVPISASGSAPSTTASSPSASSTTTATAPAAAPGARRPAATFGIGPSDGRRIDGRAGLTFLASPGSRLVDRVAVVNLAASPATLRVYAADAVSATDGSIGYQPRAVRVSGAAAWIAPQRPASNGTITLAARQTVVVPLAIRVPADASPGDHIAGVIASLTSKVRNRNGQLIDFDQRVAVRASFRISGAVKAQLAVRDLRADYHDSINPFGRGSATVSYTVQNTGNVTLGARQRVSVSGLFGETVASSVPAVPALLPKATVRLSVTVPDVLPQLRLTGRVTLFPVVIQGQTAPGLAPRFEASLAFWGVPWALLVLLVLLAAAVVAVLVWRRRRARRAPRGRHGRGRQPTPRGPDRRTGSTAPVASSH